MEVGILGETIVMKVKTINSEDVVQLERKKLTNSLKENT